MMMILECVDIINTSNVALEVILVIYIRKRLTAKWFKHLIISRKYV